jgi:hypothetical protein
MSTVRPPKPHPATLVLLALLAPALVLLLGGCGSSTTGPDTTHNARYSLTAYVQRIAGSDSGSASVTIHDDNLHAWVTNAAVTMTPQGRSPVTLTLLGTSYVALGTHTAGIAYLPVDYGSRYTVRIDLHGDGQAVATAQQRMPGMPLVTYPAQHAVLASTFDMAWTVTPANDSTFFYAMVHLDTLNSAYTQLKTGYNLASARFSGLGAGPYTGGLMCWLGPWYGGPGGQQVGPNLTGPNMSGYFWGLAQTPTVFFRVGI